ncbi:hypothetical protein OROMI_015904 [Orobanche minor]
MDTTPRNDSIQIISKELIKPSSPTPDHLKSLKLSLLDQLSPPVYISLIFFYGADELKGMMTGSTDDHSQIPHLLKHSLSNILTTYYPLVGKIDSDNFTVDCDDSGVEFIEARSRDRLKDVVENPKLESFRKYLPTDPLGGIYRGEGTLFMAQVTIFDCGGVAIGACLSHIIADGASFVKFMNAWAATCRGSSRNPEPAPDFGVIARYLPARDLSDSNLSPSLLLGNDKLVTKKFVLDREKLSILKQESSGCGFPSTGSSDDSHYYVTDPTVVEVVTAFIWKHFIEKKLLDASKKIFVAHMVNIRSRASPSLDMEHAFGNGCFMTAACTPQYSERVPKLHELVSELRKAIKMIDREYVREACDGDRYMRDLGEMCDAVTEGEGECFLFSSWFRFPIYEVDFGWGRPLLVGMTPLLLNNLAIFMDVISGDGIEVSINMLPDNVNAFEEQLKLVGSDDVINS